MRKVKARTGNSAAAAAFRQIDPDVVAAYPITPSTEVVELFSQLVAEGKVKTEFVPVESEHSAMSACIGASAAGARAMTATSSQGLALMTELLYIASGLRLPIVLALSNRALSAPLNIHGDHSDAMSVRDSGWIQVFCENAQEVYDTLIQAVRISEHQEVRLPVMVCYDGFSLSHTLERVVIEDDSEVESFLGKRPRFFPLLDSLRPVSYGPVDLPDYYTEHKRQQSEAMNRAGERILSEVCSDFKERFGREYGHAESYLLDDADVAIVIMGSASGAAKEAVDHARKHGLRAGILRIRTFRPFPYSVVRDSLQNVESIAVLDRVPVYGSLGPLYQDVISSFYPLDFRPQVASFIAGLGGRDLPVELFRKMLMKAEKNIGQEKERIIPEYFDARDGASIPKSV